MSPQLETLTYTLTVDDSPPRRIALITGASGGLGQAIAWALIAQGYDLLLHGHQHPERLSTLETALLKQYPGRRVAHFCLDLSEAEAGPALILCAKQTLGSPDVLINNAGMAQLGLVNDISPADYQRLQRLHLETPLFAAQAAFPHMLAQGFGRIVNISSIWGLYGASCEVAYSAVKAGLVGLTKALAKEWGPSGVTVNCVAPGVIETPMNQGLTSDTLEALCEETPVGRLGQAKEVAAAVAYFTGPHSGFTTGQVLSPNGGLYT